MKRGKQTEKILQKKLAEFMPHKKLAKKALALLLAAVTMIASMGTSIGMLSPVEVQAAEAIEATAEYFQIEYGGQPLTSGSSIIVDEGSLGNNLGISVKPKDGYAAGNITMKYNGGDAKPTQSGTYEISITTDAEGTSDDENVTCLQQISEPLKVGTITIHKKFAGTVKYQTEDDEAAFTSAKPLYNKDVAISADSNEVSLDGATFGQTATFAAVAAADGSQPEKKIFYFRTGEDAEVTAVEVELTFDMVAPEIDTAIVSNQSTSGADVAVTVKGTENSATYSLRNSDKAEGAPYTGDKAETNEDGQFTLEGLEDGKTYTFIVTVTDAAGNVSEKEVKVATIAKSAYSGSSDVGIVKEAAYDSETNTVTFSGIQGKTQASDYEYTVNGGTKWIAGGTAVDGGEQLSVDGTSLIITIQLDSNTSYAADSIWVRVPADENTKPSDGAKYGSKIEVPLVLKSEVTISGEAKFGKTLTASAATDQTTDLIYTFYRIAAEGGDSEKVPLTPDESGGSKYTIKKEDIGHKILVEVTAEGYGVPSNGTKATDVVGMADGKDAETPSLDDSIGIKDNAAQDAFIVTLKSQTGAQYRIVVDSDSEAGWQSSSEFTISADTVNGLSNREVTFGVRIPGDGETTNNGTEATAKIAINKIPQNPPAISCSVSKGEGKDDRIITVTEVTGAVYSFDGGSTWSETSDSNPHIKTGLTTASGTVTVNVKFPASGTRDESSAATETVDLSQNFANAPGECTIAAEIDSADAPTKYTVTVTPSEAGVKYEYSFDEKQTWSSTNQKDYVTEYESQEVTVYVRNHPDNTLASLETPSYKVVVPALKVKTPSIAGTTPFDGSTAVTISCNTDGAKIYYTTNGERPTKESNLYEKPFTISADTTIKAAAYKENMQCSEVAEKVFKKNETQTGGGTNPGTTGDSGSSSTGSSSSSGSSSGASGSGSSSATKPSTPTTTTNPDGSTTTTTTTTKSDGTKVTTSTTTATDGSKTETVTETKTDGTKTETTTETKTDGTKTESVVETGKDGSKTESTTETKPDGSKTESVTEKAADGSVVKSSETVTASDGSAVKTETENTQNAAGNDAEVTTTTKTDTAGAVTSITEETKIPESSDTTSTVVTVKKDGTGEVTSAKAAVENTVSTGKATLSASVVSQITEAAGTDSVAITMTVKDGEGNTKYEVKVDSKDMEVGSKLYVYKLDSMTGKYIMVNAKTYTVSDSGNVSLSMKENATYELVDKKEAAKINKEIKASIIPKKAAANVKPGKKTSFKLSSKAEKENIKSITYTTSNKKVAAISRNGKITAKKGGTVTVKAKVTLLNGSTKTIKMKVKVK